MPTAAICISGHARNPRIETTINQFCSVMQSIGIEIHFFLSLWDCTGHRASGWGGNLNLSNILNTISPKAILIEPFDRQHFISTFATEKYKELPHLSTNETSGDAVSMHYRIHRGLQLIKEYEALHNFTYDIIARVRTDIIIENAINAESIQHALTDKNVVYIPEWYGKWIECSGTITDYFAFGGRNAMECYMSAFPQIQEILTCNKFPHTGEGILWGALTIPHENQQKPSIKRLKNIGFSVQRENHVEKVI